MVGRKAANLSVLAQSYRVPPGFAVTAAAFDQAISGGFSQNATTGQGHQIPETLYYPIVSAYRTLSERCHQDQLSVAVRSSALDEDGISSSFAGQHDTFLNVVGEQAVADAIAGCWRSVYSPHALEYRRRHGLPLDGMKMATLVQQLVPSDVSAVVFGANPITGNREEVAINASWGLGESIVAGTVTPDTFVVRKAGMEILAAEIGEKASMTVPIPGGTQELDVPAPLQRQPSITNEQVVEMARLAVELEAKMGWPVDIECAYYQGQLYLLQCRPITTLG
jgi:pyruvate,water dikinase